jgi:hypothetical protein
MMIIGGDTILRSYMSMRVPSDVPGQDGALPARGHSICIRGAQIAAALAADTVSCTYWAKASQREPGGRGDHRGLHVISSLASRDRPCPRHRRVESCAACETLHKALPRKRYGAGPPGSRLPDVRRMIRV